MKYGAICSLDQKRFLIGWGDPTWHSAPLHYPVFYAPDFFLNDPKPYLHFPHYRIVSKILFQGYKSHFHFEEPDWTPFEAYFAKFKQSSHQKAVPFVQKKSKAVPEKVGSILQSCIEYQKKNLKTFLYGFWTKEEGMIGVTPELLLATKNKVAETIACAGTAPIDQASLMLNDPKLMKEHQMVIEGLKPLSCFGHVKTGKTKARSYSKLAHLVTRLEISHVTADFEQLIAAIHPTAALGTFPKHIGMGDYPLIRGRFGAPFGILQNKNTASIYVAIRNIQWNRTEAILTAGSGIIQESILSEEKQEILDKFKAIHEIVGV